jgi:aspartate/methionine/tyrosine aminotransferase
VEAFTVSPARLEERLTPATRAVLLGSPANPTGTVYGAAELAALAAWTAARGLWLVVDEVYDELLPGRRPAGGALAVAAGRGDRCVVVDSVAKRWAMPGWRVGWVIAPAEVAAAVARIQSHTSSHAPNVCQAAAAAAIEAGAETVASVHRLTRRGRAITLRRLEEIGLPVVPPAGAFYAFVDVRGLGAGDGGGAEAPASEAIAERLLLGHGVAVVPGEAFGAPGWLRVSFGRPADELERGLDGLAECVAACGPQTVAQ